MVMDAAGQGMKDDPSQFSVAEALIEAFESLELVDDLNGDAATTARWDDLKRRREQPEHALRFKASFEGAHGVRMGVGFLGALFGGAIMKEHQRTDDFIALLRRVVERQLEFVSIRKEPHR